MTRPKNRILPTPEEALDHLTSSITSYATFESLVSACKGGYTPVLLAVGKHSRQNVRLADALEARGCKVWKGMKSI